MDAKEQAEGEKRVRAVLIEPLEDIGLARPSTLTREKFEAMKHELCQRLAYMSEDGLTDLRQWVELHPGGKGGDRFPIGLKILKKAREIEQPEEGPSPLMLKIFRDQLGQEALRKGWAPELLKHVRAVRNWPGAWTVSQIKAQADDPVRRLEDIEMRMARGDDISAEDVQFRVLRRAALDKCQAIADAARSGTAA